MRCFRLRLAVALLWVVIFLGTESTVGGAEVPGVGGEDASAYVLQVRKVSHYGPITGETVKAPREVRALSNGMDSTKPSGATDPGDPEVPEDAMNAGTPGDPGIPEDARNPGTPGDPGVSEEARNPGTPGYPEAGDLPPDARVELRYYTAEPRDPSRRYRVGTEERLRADGTPMAWGEEPPEDSVYLAYEEIVLYAGGEPVLRFVERSQPGPDDFAVELLGPPRERARYVREWDVEAARRSVAQEVAEMTPEGVRERDEFLVRYRGPFLEKRYGTGGRLSILEVGPGTTGLVPRVFLRDDNDHRYLGLDLSEEALALQKEVLMADGFAPERLEQVAGDATETLPVPTGSQDLIVGYASIGLWGPTEQVIAQFDEFARVLKPGGEVVIGGIDLSWSSPLAVDHILQLFEVVPQREYDESVDVLLRKR